MRRSRAAGSKRGPPVLGAAARPEPRLLEVAAGAGAEAGAPSAGSSSRAPEPGPSAAAGSELALDPADAPPARMKLLDAGQPPRHKMRYAWRAGQRETLVMDLRTSASTDDGTSRQPEIELPPVHIVLAIDPQATAPAGDLSYAWRVTSTAVSPDSQTPSTLTDGMRSEVAAIEHLSGTAVVTSCGISTRISIDPEQWHEIGDAGALGDAARARRGPA